MTGAYPDLRQHLYTAEGKLRSFVNIYLNDDDIRYLPAKKPLPPPTSDELTIIPSIAGGCTSLFGPKSRFAQDVISTYPNRSDLRLVYRSEVITCACSDSGGKRI